MMNYPQFTPLSFPYIFDHHPKRTEYRPVNKLIHSIETIVPIFNNLEPIIINRAVLTPPIPGKERKRKTGFPGGKTILVGGPPIMTEEMIRDVFTRCGPISTVDRRRDKSFCVRFDNTESVDQAFLLHDFKIRIDIGEDKICNSKISINHLYDYRDHDEYDRLQNVNVCQETKEEYSQETINPNFDNLKPVIINRAVLTPPQPGKVYTFSPRPIACKTVFVGNLPENITEEIIKDAFSMCGEITAVRMSRKNYCHIRFDDYESVDQALFLHDFHIRIDESEDSANNGRLHIDYATNRKDQDSYERLQRASNRMDLHNGIQTTSKFCPN